MARGGAALETMTGGNKLFPITLAAGVTGINFVTYLHAAFIAIGLRPGTPNCAVLRG